MRCLRPFMYYHPETKQEALSILEELGGEAKVLAGGTDLLVSMKTKELFPRALINLKGINKIRGLTSSEGILRIGALSTIDSVINSPLVSNVAQILSDACKSLGTPQVRNLATLGGNVCNASPAADAALALLALDAKLRIVSSCNERLVSATEFFIGPSKSIMRSNEILTHIEVLQDTRFAGVYLKHGTRQAHDLAIVGVAVLISLEDDNVTCREARICLGAVAPTPMRVRASEHVLVGNRLSRRRILEAARAAAEESKPIDDVRSSASYRKEMVQVLTEQGIGMAVRAYHKKLKCCEG